MKNCVFLLMLILFVSCQRPLYRYYDYDEATYKYSTAYDDKDYKLASKSYEKIVGADKKQLKKNKSKEPKKNRIAPGACVDYAIIMLQEGDTIAAKSFFEKEVHLFPESKQYVESIKRDLGL